MKTFRLIILLAAFSFMLCSCGIFSLPADYGSTSFSNTDIQLGDAKEVIISKYGNPYTQELERVDGKIVETLGYKERMNFGYSINTFFQFEDGKLIRKWQSEDKPSSAKIQVDDD